MTTTSERLVIIRPDDTEFSLDMTALRSLEARQFGAAGAGRIESLVLMGAMKDGYKEAGDLRVKVGVELENARTSLATRKAIVRLDLAPEILRQKGLTSSRSPNGTDTQKEDVILTDQVCVRLSRFITELEALRELLHIKMETFRMTYSTVKRNVDDSLAGMLPGYSGGAPDPKPVQAFIDTAGRQITMPPATRQQELKPAADDPYGGLLIGKARY